MTQSPAEPPADSSTTDSLNRPASSSQVEVSGRSVAEAIERGLASLGFERDRVDVDVLDEGSRGILGLGGREARVRLTVRAGRAEAVGAIAREMLALMGISADVAAEEGPESIRVNVAGADVGPLIGKHGQTLGAVEALLSLMVGRTSGAPVRIELDAEGYRERREASLQDLARRTAERVARQGREIALIPMGPRDRRIIHVTLQEHPKVSTMSRGERDLRRVVVMPKGAPAPGVPGEGPGEMDSASESQPGTPVSRESWRSGRPQGSGRPRFPRGRSEPLGREVRRTPRQGSTGSFSRRPQPAGQRAARPDGLPVDEELEAEIEAYLARTNPENSKEDRQATEPQSDPRGSPDDEDKG